MLFSKGQKRVQRTNRLITPRCCINCVTEPNTYVCSVRGLRPSNWGGEETWKADWCTFTKWFHFEEREREKEKEKEESSGVKHRKCISVAMLKPDMDGTRWASIPWNWLCVEKVIRSGTSPFNLKRTIGGVRGDSRCKIRCFQLGEAFTTFTVGLTVPSVKRAEKYLYVSLFN